MLRRRGRIWFFRGGGQSSIIGHTSTEKLESSIFHSDLGEMRIKLAMPSDATNMATKQEWRELGFFYSRDDQAKVWTLTGSRAGLLRFRDALLTYTDDPQSALESEHKHYGPYAYLEVMTWHEAGFDAHSIRGPLIELARLAIQIESRLATAQIGSSVRIQEEFAPNSPYALVLDLREDEFDPASADPLLPREARSYPDL